MWGGPAMTPYGAAPVSDADALTVACPLCSAAPNTPCVYVWPYATPRYRAAKGRASAAYKAVLARVDTPTKRAHTARRNALFRNRQRAETASRWSRSPTVAPRWVRDAAAAMAAWDRDEYLAMQTWLRANADIFGALVVPADG